MQQLATFLKDNAFEIDGQLKLFNRIYFNKSGAIDYYLYNINPGQLSKEEAARFDTLLNVFVKNHKIGVSAEVNFSQCSPVTIKEAQ